MTLVSIVILNWNGKKYLEKFLPSVLEHSQAEGAEVVVADNNSTDDSIRFMESTHPSIRLIPLDQNYGFTGGYNRALEQLDSKYFLLLNSDVEVTAGWLEPLIRFMESHHECGLCTPKVKDFNLKTHFEYAGAAGGYIDRFGYPFCRGRLFDHVEEDRGQYDQETEIFWASGACLMVRADLYKKAGGLDERFFAHMEEIDLCWRLKRMGHSIYFIPSSTIYHVGGGTLDYRNPRKTYFNFRNNLLLLYKNLPLAGKRRIIFSRMILDGISAFRFLLRADFRDFMAVIRAHASFYGMKGFYRGTNNRNNLNNNPVIVSGIYPGSIVADFFLRGRKQFGELNWSTGSLRRGQ